MSGGWGERCSEWLCSLLLNFEPSQTNRIMYGGWTLTLPVPVVAVVASLAVGVVAVMAVVASKTFVIVEYLRRK